MAERTTGALRVLQQLRGDGESYVGSGIYF